jgi:hypothetical protein
MRTKHPSHTGTSAKFEGHSCCETTRKRKLSLSPASQSRSRPRLPQPSQRTVAMAAQRASIQPASRSRGAAIPESVIAHLPTRSVSRRGLDSSDPFSRRKLDRCSGSHCYDHGKLALKDPKTTYEQAKSTGKSRACSE